MVGRQGGSKRYHKIDLIVTFRFIFPLLALLMFDQMLDWF